MLAYSSSLLYSFRFRFILFSNSGTGIHEVLIIQYKEHDFALLTSSQNGHLINK